MWLGDAWFGAMVVLLSRGKPTQRLGGLALFVGSLLAFTGMDRLGLTGQGKMTFFTTASLTGVFLNGCGWVLLGAILIRLRPAELSTGRTARTVAVALASAWCANHGFDATL
jgi:hypothetical protein